LKVRANFYFFIAKPENIDLADKSFCHNIIVKSQKSEIVDYSKYYNKFSEA
jgi:hypothetical protein